MLLYRKLTDPVQIARATAAEARAAAARDPFPSTGGRTLGGGEGGTGGGAGGVANTVAGGGTGGGAGGAAVSFGVSRLVCTPCPTPKTAPMVAAERHGDDAKRLRLSPARDEVPTAAREPAADGAAASASAPDGSDAQYGVQSAEDEINPYSSMGF